MGSGGPDIGKRPDKVVRETASAPVDAIGTEGITTGTVKWWNDRKGYGAVASKVTEPWDIWCHFSSVLAPGYRSLQSGERVEVAYVRADQDSFKYVARRVRRVESTDQGAG